MARRQKTTEKPSGAVPHLEREVWLEKLASGMTAWFEDLGFPLPPFEIRSGFPSGGARNANIAESWLKDAADSYVIYVRPDRNDQSMVSAAVALQLCVIALGDRDTHGHLFKHLAISIGLKGSASEHKPGALFRELVGPILKRIGPIPRGEISSPAQKRGKPQTTRMVKVTCPACGYLVRVSRKWLERSGPPHCPEHGEMEPDN